MRNFKPSRRHFLKVGASALGGLVIGIEFDSEASAATGVIAGPWIRIEPSGDITVVVDKSEMGQGVWTALPMLVAEELDADWSKIRVVQAPAAPEYKHPWFGVQATGGSTSVRAMWGPLREAGASARALMLEAASKTWGVGVESLRTESSTVIGAPGRLAYGELAALASTLPLPKAPALKDPKDFRIIGQSLPRTDLLGKVTGQAGFGLDVRVPGLRFASVERAPVLGAKVVSFDASEALKTPGVLAVHSIEGPVASGVAVVAKSTHAAKTARSKLKVTWSTPPQSTMSTESLEQTMKELAHQRTGARVARETGNVATATASQTLMLEYAAPYLAHATMEPMNATASVTKTGVELWAPTQAQGPHQFIAAQIAGCKPEAVKVNTTFLGGGFGRRFAPDFIVEAVTLSKLESAPVQVVYTREDDMRAQYYRPMAYANVRVGLDKEGTPVFFDGVTVTDSIAAGSGFEAALVKNGIDQTSVEGLADFPYAVPHFKLDWVHYSPGVRTWFWRSVGSTENGFFTESIVDELAHKAGRDPYEYRRSLLSAHPRHRGVLDAVAKLSGFGSPVPHGRARGIAVCESFGSYVAEVAEVSVEEGRIKVHRVWIAADVGIVVNPAIVKAQLEGAMIYGLSAALAGKITYQAGAVEQSNFDDYPILRMDETPAVEITLVPSMEAPGGVGEPGTPPIAPAVANAVFALTGKRLRHLPLEEGLSA